MRRRYFLIAGLALGLSSAGLGGCAVQAGRLLGGPPDDLPRYAELASTPFFADEEYYCGPAALAAALGAAGVHVDPDTLADDVFLPGREGSLQLEMLAGARRHGAVATVIPGSLEAILREIDGGQPVVVLQNLGLSWAPSWHYAVVIGYDLDRRHLLLRSGPIERQALAIRTFEHTWKRGNHWAFVVLPPGRLPVTAEEREATHALVAFERSAEPAQAELAYATALKRWPDSLTLAMGLGNTQYAMGDLAAALETFDQAARRHRSPAAYHNLAIVLLEQGQCDAARAAALQGLEPGGPLEDMLRDTLDRIDAARSATAASTFSCSRG